MAHFTVVRLSVLPIFFTTISSAYLHIKSESLRSYSFSYLNQTRRLQWMANVFSYALYYYPNYAYYAPELISVLSYRDAIATRGITGLQVTGYYPFNMYYRLETSAGYTFYEEDFYDPYMNQILNNIGNTYNYFWNGSSFLGLRRVGRRDHAL